jgi:hypothetical protein
MKTIKFTTAFIALIFSANLLRAQEYKVPVENTKDGKVTIEDFMGDFPVEGYNGNEIIITTTSERFSKPPEKAKGLKPVFAGGQDNTGIGVFVEKNGNNITLQCLLPITEREEYKIKVPNNLALKIHSDCGRSGDITVSNMTGEVEVSNCQGIDLKNVTGPIVLSTISGSIDLKLGNLPKDRPISIASVSGDIDVSLAATSAANVELRTVSGSIYSDFDLQPKDKSEMRRIGGNSSIHAQLNGGGAALTLTNVSGNIYLRKSGGQ